MYSIRYLFFFILLSSFCEELIAQNRSLGLIKESCEEAYEGYTLFAPLQSTNSYLIDNKGFIINQWESSDRPGNSVYLLPNGTLLRATQFRANTSFQAGGVGGRLEILSWEGDLLWEYVYSSDKHAQHHDLEPLPNGNILLIAWDLYSKEEAIQAGRNPDLLSDDVIWSEKIIEIKPLENNEAEIVWEWYFWDHLIQDFDPDKDNFGVVDEHPEKLNMNYIGRDTGKDWIHLNSIDYNVSRDEIIINSPFTNEFYIIDHSTTTEEARGTSGGNRGLGGSLLYRWGNPLAYRRGRSEQQQLFGQHNAQWIPESFDQGGSIILFNNGLGRTPEPYSSIDIIRPPIDLQGNYILESNAEYGPDAPAWTYSTTPKSDFYGSFISGVQRLPNGNTLICNGPFGTFQEINSNLEIVWEYISPVTASGLLSQGEDVPILNDTRWANLVFRAERYSPDFAGFQGRELIAGELLELNSEPLDCIVTAINFSNKAKTGFKVYPNPFYKNQSLKASLEIASSTQNKALEIWTTDGIKVTSVRINPNEISQSTELDYALRGLLPGVYILKMLNKKHPHYQRILILD